MVSAILHLLSLASAFNKYQYTYVKGLLTSQNQSLFITVGTYDSSF